MRAGRRRSKRPIAARVQRFRAPSIERYEVSRCSEDPTQHVVRIEWDSQEGHLDGFRQSREFHAFFEAVGPFVHDIEEMRHYQVTQASDNRASS
jgi:quinol monooxygenase YgiN